MPINLLSAFINNYNVFYDNEVFIFICYNNIVFSFISLLIKIFRSNDKTKTKYWMQYFSGTCFN